MLKKILETDRLLLRVWAIEDIDTGISIWGDSDVMKYIDSGRTLNREEVENSLKAGILHQQKYGFQHWAVIQKEENKIIGCCGFNCTEEENVLELVFHFAKKYWGNGYATEAAKACLEYGFKKLKTNKIIAGAHPENKASQNVLEKIGFTHKGMQWFEDTQQEEPVYEIVAPNTNY